MLQVVLVTSILPPVEYQRMWQRFPLSSILPPILATLTAVCTARRAVAKIGGSMRDNGNRCYICVTLPAVVGSNRMQSVPHKNEFTMTLTMRKYQNSPADLVVCKHSLYGWL